MIYCCSGNCERLFMHEKDELDKTHWIDISVGTDAPVFEVTCCCNDDWVWAFAYDKTTYDLVKYAIMDCIMACDTVEELIEALDDVFETEFSEVVVDIDECDCICCGCEEECFDDDDDDDEDDDSEYEEEFDCDGDCDACECRKTCVE